MKNSFYTMDIIKHNVASFAYSTHNIFLKNGMNEFHKYWTLSLHLSDTYAFLEVFENRHSTLKIMFHLPLTSNNILSHNMKRPRAQQFFVVIMLGTK